MWLPSTPQWKLCWNVAFWSILLAIPPLWLHGDHSKFYLCDFVVYRVLFNSPFSSHHNPARYVDIVFPITNCFLWYKSQFVPVFPEAPFHPSMCLVDGEQEGWVGGGASTMSTMQRSEGETVDLAQGWGAFSPWTSCVKMRTEELSFLYHGHMSPRLILLILNLW